MAERSQYQYTPIQGPVWREPVAEKMQWLPEGQQPARGLTPNSLGSYARPEFAALYVPAGLQWTSSDRYSGQRLPYSLVRSYILDPIPPEDPRRLEWVPQDRYFGRSLPRSAFDWSVYPQLVAAPVFDPQDLEWVPKGTAPQVPLEFRRAGDFVQPAFDALYKPERLEWLLEGQQPARAIPFIWQGSWVCDPTTPATVVFDPQLFPFQATDLVVARSLPFGVVGDYATPPLPPGPDVVVPDTGLGGSSAVHPRRVIYERGAKRKPKTFIDRIGEPFLPLEETPEPVPDAAAAGAVVDTASVRSALAARLPAPLPPSVATPLVVRPLDDDEDDDLLLLS